MKQDTQSLTTTSISFSSLALGCILVLYSWSLFILLPGSMVVLATLPICLLVVWGLTRKAGDQGRHLSVKGWQQRLFWLLVLLFVIAAPIFSFLYGYYHATRLFLGLGVVAGQVEIDYQLLDRFGDIGGERYFTIFYQVLEPLEEAEAKIRQRLETRPDWYLRGPNPIDLYPIRISADCHTPRYFGLIGDWNFPITHSGVTIFESGRMGVGFVYEQPRSCTDLQ